MSGNSSVSWDENQRPDWTHTCNGASVTTHLPLGPSRWQAHPETNSVTPSLFCQDCGTHGFWTRGEWHD